MSFTRVKMGRISYINASPVYYGLDNGLAPDWLDLVTDVPAALNRQIKEGYIDISPISSAYYAKNFEDLLLLPDFSISCHGPVASVICASNYPMEELGGRRVMFSNESATSASLLKMIFNMKKICPDYIVGRVGNIKKVPSGVDAVMVIGDAALTQAWETRYQFRIDLGQHWFEMTGLPFVFAVWVVRKSFAAEHPDRVKDSIELFLASRKQGEKNMARVVAAGQDKLGLDRPLIQKYYDLLFCDLDVHKVEGMRLFFDLLYKHGILERPAEIQFF